MTVDFFGIEDAVLDNLFRAVAGDATKEAASVSFVANTWSHRIDSDEQGIGVAVDAHVEHLEDVSARFTFFPKSIARTGKKYNLARPLRLRECHVVHEAEHEHVARSSILDDGGDEPAGFFEVELHARLSFV